MQWYRITLSRQEYEDGELTILQGAFRDAYIAGNGPRGMALLGIWSNDESGYWVYVTPAAARHVRPLLDAYSAAPSAPRDPLALSLIYGDADCLSVLIC